MRLVLVVWWYQFNVLPPIETTAKDPFFWGVTMQPYCRVPVGSNDFIEMTNVVRPPVRPQPQKKT